MGGCGAAREVVNETRGSVGPVRSGVGGEGAGKAGRRRYGGEEVGAA